MTTPHSEGWYDDPDGSDAERYFNGQDWTPQRRRKEPKPKRPSQTSDPHGPGSTYPSAASGSYAPPAPAGPRFHIRLPSRPPPYAYGPPPPTGPVDPYGPVGPGYPQQPAVSGLRSGMATGVNRMVGVLIAACGLALVVAAFVPWGKARQVGTDQGAVVSVTASFPGLGEPRISGTYSNVAITSNMNVNSPLFQLHNTDPGWIALALGIVALLAGAACLWLPQRRIAAIAVAILGAIVGVVCVSHFFDVRATFGNPPNLADVNFSPGAGLVAGILPFAVAGLGVWAYIIEPKPNHSTY